MKKRVLSLLLLLAMVVTALPVFALPVFADEPEDEEPAVFNYDSLYSTTGLIYAIDFYKSNEFWDPEGDDFVQPPSPIDNSAYLHTDGVTYDFTVPANRLTADGTALNEAYLAAIDAWGKSATGTDRDFLRQFVTKSVSGTYAFSYVPSKTVALANYFVSAYQIGRGYVTIDERTHSSGGLQFGGFGGDNATDATAMHTIYDASVGRSNPHILWHNIRPSYNAESMMTGFADGTDTFTPNADGFTSVATDFSGLRNEVYSLTGAETKGGTEDVFTIWDKSGVLASVQGTYDPKPHPTTGADRYLNFIGSVYFGWSDHMNGGKIYAVRQYNQGFTAEQYELNAFADLCKWYKLDMGLYDTLKASQITELRDEILAFAEAEGIAVGGGADQRAALQEKFTDATLDIAYGELTALDPSAEAAAFAEIAKNVMVDISGVLGLPMLYRGRVYAAVSGLTAAQKESAATVQFTIDSEIETILETYYGQYINRTDLTYMDLYARQDNIVLWMDFFAARETDGNLYMAHSWVEDGNFNKAAEFRTQKIEISGEADAREKYIYRGGNYFTFADIPESGWGHTNIRTWGDGKLVCGKNNSFHVKSPGVDKESITYQFVAGWEIDGTARQDQMNVQLDGFRMEFQMDAGGIDGMFNIPAYTRYGYGVATDTVTLNSNALLNVKPGLPATHVGDSMDLTIVVDKFIGSDEGHYFIEKYKTNADGAIEYIMSDVKPDPKLLSTYTRLYRYQIDGAWYYLTIDNSTTPATYAALYAETMAEKPKQLSDGEGYLVSSVPVLRDGNTMSFDWDNAVYVMEGTDKVMATNELATNVYGPCYSNPFEEVPFGTPGATGPITYYGTNDLGVYVNGNQFLYTTGNSYQRSDIGWVGNGSNMTFYAVRTYDCILTEDEIKQNHFADLAGFYGLDLSSYAILTAEERRALHADLADLQLGLDYELGRAAYQEAIDAYLYAFELDSFDEDAMVIADNFLAICHNLSLNTRELKELSPESLLRIFSLFEDVDPEARNHAPVVQKQVADAVAEEVRDRYASAYGHKSINFEGWQVRTSGDFGLRALYSTDLSRIPALEAAGATVMTGVLVAKHGAEGVTDLSQLTVTVDAAGEVVIPDGATLVKGYWGGELGATAERKGTTLYFTHDTILDIEDPEDPEVLADALERERYYYAGFTVLIVGEGEDRAVSIFYDDAKTDGNKGAQSVFSLSRIAKKYKMSSLNIQTTMKVCDEQNNIEITVGDRSISAYSAVLSASRAELNEVQDTLFASIGFRLNEIRAADVASYEHLLYVGTADNIYDSKCYGITIVGGNIYIWANVDAEIADACALFNDYILAMHEAEENVFFEENFEIVRRTVD